MTGEEDRYSHTEPRRATSRPTSDGAQAAFNAIRPALAKRDPSLATLIDGRFETVDGTLAAHRDGDGFVAYDTLGRGEVRTLSQVVDALAEPLSRAPAGALAG